MEVDQPFNKIELIRKLKNKAINNENYGEVLNELLNYYMSVEKSENINSISVTCLILLFCILGNYEEASLRRTKYKNLNIFSSNEEFVQLFQISKRLIREPYIDIYGHINFFLKSNSFEVNSIALSYKNIYEREQAVYLSKFFSKIKLVTLKKLLGVHYVEDKFGEYLIKYGWILKDEYILLAPVQENFDSSQLKEDLDFINRMTVSLENIAKANTSIKPIESLLK